MDLGGALITRLKGNTDAGDAVHWGVRPQGSADDCIVLRSVGGASDDTLEDEDDDQIFVEASVEVSSYSRSHETARRIDRQAKALLKPEATVDDLNFWHADAGEPINLGEDDSKGFLHRIARDFVIRHGAES